ncbi:DUF547 domain-containing protein [Coraliomargarita sp. SDUM461004]|uniref:DUF547 domain-containing protein n=1 Tax=Thalassobacterium sedimentorum TaxID=3041258 RepID=A0ABU1AJ24_9BACT|nr:DUF547 domain-containing protein [Coraliomargarita sp. SDUM461004]MDQ8193761.1 DUF547 domain-containing protein [Coraliomargarita sp. SDUM461004]
MKFFSLVCVFLAAMHFSDAKVDYTSYAELLHKYVQADGVSYDVWAGQHADVAALNAVLAEWAQISVAELSADEQKAFYINLYNAGMLQAVLERYPIKSVKDIGLIPFSIFKKNYIQLMDRSLSLDNIEKGILLKDFPDPRIHFAVNCASVSCPPLRAEPYRAKQLDQQLEAQTRLFAASDHAARVNVSKQRTAYSELFKWYASDFAVTNPALFLNRYRSEPLPIEHTVIWIDYDWSLNQSQ